MAKFDTSLGTLITTLFHCNKEHGKQGVPTCFSLWTFKTDLSAAGPVLASVSAVSLNEGTDAMLLCLFNSKNGDVGSMLAQDW